MLKRIKAIVDALRELNGMVMTLTHTLDKLEEQIKKFEE